MSSAAVQRAIKRYYETIAEMHAQRVTREGGLRRAFEQLLVDGGREHGWSLIAEETLSSGKRKNKAICY